MKIPKSESKTVEFKTAFNQDAIREVILNMLVHRDYRDPGGVSTIKIFDDHIHIEFTNAGGLPTGLTVKTIISDAYTSSPGNPKIADVFKDAGLVERYGFGIKCIIDACKAHGKVAPEFKDMGTWSSVILRKKIGEALVEQGNDSLKSDLEILALLSDEPDCTYDKPADSLKLSRSAIKKQIRNSQSSGRLRRVWPDKCGHREILGGRK